MKLQERSHSDFAHLTLHETAIMKLQEPSHSRNIGIYQIHIAIFVYIQTDLGLPAP